MNSYELSRKFFDYCFDNPEKVKPNHVALYFFAIEHCNRLGWKEKFGLPTEMTKSAIGIHSYNTYTNTLKDLIDWGFIILVKKSVNQYSSNIIALSNFDKAHNNPLDKAIIKHGIKQSESTGESIDSINKQLTNNKEPLTTFELAIKDFKEMRKKIKAELTEVGEKRLRAELEKLAPNDVDLQIKILEQSILHSWRGVFALKKDSQGTKVQPERDENGFKIKKSVMHT